MDLVRKEIFDTIEDRDDLNLTKVAALIGSSKQALSDYKKGRKNLGFRFLIRLSYLLFDNPVQKFSQWCLRLDTTESIRQAFEYASVTRNKELLGDLLTKYKRETGVIGDCVKVYSILYKYMTNQIKGTDLLEEINKIKTPSEKTLTILINIIKCYSYYYSGKFFTMLESTKDIEKEINSIGNRELFIKESFIHRICELYAPAYLHLNNLQLARYYGNILINSNFCAKSKSDGYYIVGMSYLLEDREKSLENLQASYDILSNTGEEDLIRQAKYNLDFARVHFGIKPEENSLYSLRSFYEARRGTEDAIKLVEKAVEEEGYSNFKLYYKGLALKSKEILIEAYNNFFEQCNFFFAGLVAQDLKNFGEDTSIIESILKFKAKKEGEIFVEKDFISCFNDFNDFRNSNCG
jgi:hypothetical protein